MPAQERKASYARITLGNRAADTRIEIDGMRPQQIESVTLSARVDERGTMSAPATLELRRVLTPSQAVSRGYVERDDVTTLTTPPREDERITIARIEIDGAVQLVDDAMRAALDQARGSALDGFMMQTEGGLAYSLGDLLRDAVRYRALRRYVESPEGGSVALDGLYAFQLADNADQQSPTLAVAHMANELDAIVDELRAAVRGDDGFAPLHVTV